MAEFIPAIIAAGSAGYSVVTGNEARAKAEKQQAQYQADQKKLQDETIQKQNDASKASASAQLAAQERQRQKSAAAASQGRRGTILTSPLGGSSSPAYSGKTLLGM